MTQAIKVSTNGLLEVVDVNSYEQLSELVGGYIENVTFTNTLNMYINEEGKLNGSQFNFIATKVWELFFEETDIIVGDAVFFGGMDNEGNDRHIKKEYATLLRQYQADYLNIIVS